LSRVEEERSALKETIASLRQELDDVEESLTTEPSVPPASAGEVPPDLATTAIRAQRRRLERVVGRYRALLDAAPAASVQEGSAAASLGGD
jgi:hypothetical protein